MAIAAPAALALTTGFLPIHICPPGVRQIVEIIVPNFNTSNPATVTLSWTDVSAANATATFAITDIAAKDAIVSPRKVLESGDIINGNCSAAGYCVASANVVYEEPNP